MREERKFICVTCPVGCGLSVALEDGEIVGIEGNSCPRGESYARTEVSDPRRVFASTDPMMFQPFRIEHGDNANLLLNAVGWLARRPVTDAMREKFRKSLFLTEADLKRIKADEK